MESKLGRYSRRRGRNRACGLTGIAYEANLCCAHSQRLSKKRQRYFVLPIVSGRGGYNTRVGNSLSLPLGGGCFGLPVTVWAWCCGCGGGEPPVAAAVGEASDQNVCSRFSTARRRCVAQGPRRPSGVRTLCPGCPSTVRPRAPFLLATPNRGARSTTHATIRLGPFPALSANP